MIRMLNKLLRSNRSLPLQVPLTCRKNEEDRQVARIKKASSRRISSNTEQTLTCNENL